MDDLIEACNNSIYEFTGTDLGIKRRQIFEDIKFMESPQGWNIPLEHYRDGHKVYYRYSDLSFSINNQPLNEAEQSQLKEALHTLSRFKGMPQFEWVDELTARLDSSLGINSMSTKLIEFDENPYLKGREHISHLYFAISNQQVVSIVYNSFKSASSQTIEFHPYYLKQYNNRWFVFGKNDRFEELQNLALDRILAIKDSNLKFVPNEQIDFQEYFEDVIGVSINPSSKPEIVELEISKELFPYIETKPLHGSQKVLNRTEAQTKISIEVKLNHELEALLLSYGEGIKILKPENLKSTIKKRLAMMHKLYEQ
jgi:predicted DNA-binding transcriptional regulator YafY